MTTIEKFVGIDVSKDTLDVRIEPDTQALSVAYNDEGIGQVCQRLIEAAPTLIVMEATGGLETRLASELAAKGLKVAVVNPRQVRDFAKATGQLAKTDRVDAAVLAAFARAIRPAVRPLKDTDTRALDDRVTRRRQLIAMRVQETLRLGTAASKPLQKSLNAHIAWLDKRIAEIDTDLTRWPARVRRLANQGRSVTRHSRRGRGNDPDLVGQVSGVGDTQPPRNRRAERCSAFGQR